MAAETRSDARASKSVERGEHLDARNQLLDVLEDSLDNGPKPSDRALLEPASASEQHQNGGEAVVAHSGMVSQNVVEEAVSDATDDGVRIGNGHTGSGINHDAEERNASEQGKEPDESGVSGRSGIDDTAADSGMRIDAEQEQDVSRSAEMESGMANPTENPTHEAGDSIGLVEEKVILGRDSETMEGSTSNNSKLDKVIIDHVETETGIDQTGSSSDATEGIPKAIGTPATLPASDANFREEQISEVDYRDHADEDARSRAGLASVVSMDLEGWQRFDDADGGAADPSRVGAPPRPSVELWEQLLDSGLDSAPQVVTQIGGSESRSARIQEGFELASPGNPFADGAVRLSDFSDWDEFAFRGNAPDLADAAAAGAGAASRGFASSPFALPFGAGSPSPSEDRAQQHLSRPATTSLYRRRELSFSDSLNIVDGGDKWEANFDPVVVVAAPPAQQMMSSSAQSRPQQILPGDADPSDVAAAAAARARASSSGFPDMEPKLRPSLMKKVVGKARALQVLSSSSPLEGPERDQKSALGHCFCW